MAMIRIRNGFRKAIVNPFGDVAQFVLTAIEDTDAGAKIMLAEVDGLQVWDHLPVRRQNQDQNKQLLLDQNQRDFFGVPLTEAFEEAARQPETITAARALDALGSFPRREPRTASDPISENTWQCN